MVDAQGGCSWGGRGQGRLWLCRGGTRCEGLLLALPLTCLVTLAGGRSTCASGRARVDLEK